MHLTNRLDRRVFNYDKHLLNDSLTALSYRRLFSFISRRCAILPLLVLLLMAVILILLALNAVSLVFGNMLLPDTLNQVAPSLGNNISSAFTNLDPVSRLAKRAGVCTIPGDVQCPNSLIYCCPVGEICQLAIPQCCPSYGLQCSGRACCDPMTSICCPSVSTGCCLAGSICCGTSCCPSVGYTCSGGLCLIRTIPTPTIPTPTIPPPTISPPTNTAQAPPAETPDSPSSASRIEAIGIGAAVEIMVVLAYLLRIW
ncbi:hypothetical protein C8J57DRAFT_47178 [Mycena rebaudengoi]|nr:hypothetical protein C8J57DRAFT_47178 [Mycena rebaudengoi]